MHKWEHLCKSKILEATHTYKNRNKIVIARNESSETGKC